MLCCYRITTNEESDSSATNENGKYDFSRLGSKHEDIDKKSKDQHAASLLQLVYVSAYHSFFQFKFKCSFN